MNVSPVVVIVGGGATGSSVAAHLAADPDFGGRVVVIEKDPSYRLAASALSAASVRQQYSQPVNIRLSLHGVAVLRDPTRHLATEGDVPTIGLHEGGYLYLATSPDGADALRESHAIQIREGADIALLDPNALQERFAWLATADLVLGAYGLSGEGWFDGWALLQGLRRKARHDGAEYVAGEVVGLDLHGDRIAAVRLASGESIACDVLVNCAGSGGTALAAMAGIAIPVAAKRRTVFAFTCRTPISGAPLLIDPSGVWWRPDGPQTPQGQAFIAGWSPPPEADPDWSDADPESQAVDWRLWDEVVWPALAARVPAFEAVRPGRAWAGPYDMNLLDHNAIVGPARPVANLHLCNGFSGHGLQHAAAVGRGLAELIVHGGYTTLDLSDLGYDRIVAGRPLFERNVI